MGNLYLFFRLLAVDVDQMMKPEMTSRTASRVVTMIDKEPLIAAMATRTSNNTLHSTATSCQSTLPCTTTASDTDAENALEAWHAGERGCSHV